MSHGSKNCYEAASLSKRLYIYVRVHVHERFKNVEPADANHRQLFSIFGPLQCGIAPSNS